MKNIAIGVESITVAIKARKLLREEKIHSRISRGAAIREHIGCEYALEISERDFFSAVAVLRRASISYRLDK